jgi:hypothetical protein
MQEVEEANHVMEAAEKASEMHAERMRGMVQIPIGAL